MKANFIFIFVCTLIYCCPVIAQDRIYLASEQKEGKVTDITTDKVKYKNPQNPGPVYTISRDKVMFIFNSTGAYYVACNGCSEEKSKQFLQATTLPSSDMIFTNDGNRISCMIDREDNEAIYYAVKNSPSKIEKTKLAAVIYRSGQHKIIGEYARVAEILKRSQDGTSVAASATETPGVASTEKMIVKESNQSQPPAQTLIVKEKSNQAESVVAKETNRQVEVTPERAAPNRGPENPEIKPQPASVVTRERDTVARNRNRELITEELGVNYQEYEKKALQKTHELSDFIKIVCDKNTEYEKADKAIDQACLLFVNEDATVSVSTLGKQVSARYKVRDYLRKLKLLKYGRVEIEWTNIQYVSKLRKGPDGNFYGVISFEQTFKGYLDNQLVYSDVTRKNIEVVLKSYKKSVEGKTQMSWDVLLSDIGVVETKKS
jgi:TATA-box binding protein (TBP) (component of TFIID and TFIIIB)